MALTLLHPDRPVSRLWRPGHPLEPRCGIFRRITMVLILVLLGGIIGAYMFLTDSLRVRHEAEAYLTNLLGGPVVVGHASLSIFDGLTLSNVTVSTSTAHTPDAILLKADAFELEMDPIALLHGRLAASRLLVSGPHVRLVENVDNGTWNYQQLVRTLRRRPHTPSRPNAPTYPPPEIVLRDAQLQYCEIRNARYSTRGTIALEGRLWPNADGTHYSFELQSRNAANSPGIVQVSANEEDVSNADQDTDPAPGGGPLLVGQVRLADGQVDAALANLRFGRDIEAMLPSEVRDWWDAHQIQGLLNIPAFHYVPPIADRRAQFYMETKLDHVQLSIPYQELTSGPVARAWDQRQQLLDSLSDYGANLAGAVDEFEHLTTPPPITVSDVSGTYRFDEHGVILDHLLGRISQNLLTVNGHIDGYSPDAPAHIRIASAPGQPFIVQRQLPIAASMPPIVQEIYNMIRPYGTGAMWLSVDRPTQGATPQVTGEIRVDDGGFACKFYPYPVTHAHGVVAFVHDPGHNFGQVEFRNIQGLGLPSGPNAAAPVYLNGWVGPFDRRVGFAIHIDAPKMVSEPALFQALPKPIAAAAASAWVPNPAHPNTPVFPTLQGAVHCDVTMPIGIHTKPSVAVDLDIHDATARLAAFPYPLRHLSGHLAVRADRLDFTNIAMTTPAGAAINATANVIWHSDDNLDITDVQPHIQLAAKNLPIDADLLSALTPDQQSWIKNAGVTGRIDVDGTAGESFPANAPTTQPTLGYDLHLTLRDGALAPPHKTMVVNDVAGAFHLTPDRFTVEHLTGRRQNAALAATGAIDYTAATPTVTMTASANALPLDSALHQALPTSAQSAWDALAPTGSVNANLTYAGPIPDLFDTTPATAPSTQNARLLRFSEAAPAPTPTPQYTLTLQPHQLSVRPLAVPYQLDDCKGTITVTPADIHLDNITAQHGLAHFTADGTGQAGDQSDWNLRLTAADVPIDPDLQSALPTAAADWISRAHLHGTLSANLAHFHYQSATHALALEGTVRADNAKLDQGVPVNDITGSVTGQALLKDNHLAVLNSQLNLDSMDLAARPIRNLSANLTKSGGDNTLHLDQINGELANGRFAGTLTTVLPSAQGSAPPSTYTLDLILKNADVATIAGPNNNDLRGQLSASLAMQGQWTDPATRRGRGDVVVTGQSLYQIPLLLGLWDVTNLALPATSPFNQATARYNLDGKRVTFEQITMRSDAMVMSGNGFLDFGSKQVRMNFETDNTNWPQLPFIHDLVQGAKSELMRIQIRGTVQEPKVSAAPLHTFTTTVDQVLGSAEEK